MVSLLNVPFYQDELLTSFVSRLARANGRMSMRGFCQDLGVSCDSLVRGEMKAIAALEYAINKRPGELVARSVVKKDTRHLRLGDMIFATGAVTPSVSRFCPACVSEDEEDARRLAGTRPYARIQWSLPCFGACERHNLKLVRLQDRSFTHTELANNPQGWRSTGDFCALIDLWRSPSSQHDHVKSEATPFERFVADRLKGVVFHGSLLDALSLPVAIEAAQLLGLGLTVGKLFDWQNVDHDEMRDACASGFSRLSEGIAGVEDVLDRLSVNVAKVSGRASYGTLYEVLARRSASFEPIKAILHRHLSERKIRQTSSSNNLIGEKLVSIDDIALATGMPPRTVARFLLQRGHIQTLDANLGTKTVQEDVARNAIKALRDTASFADVKAILGCSVSQLRSIASSGFLKLVIGKIPEGARSGLDRYSKSDMLALRRKVLARTIGKSGGQTSLSVAADLFGIDVGSALVFLLDGRLSKLSFDDSLPLLLGLLVDVDELSGLHTRDLANEKLEIRQTMAIPHETSEALD